MNHFGKAFRDERLRVRMTLREIAEFTGKAISYWSDVEHGRKGAPDLETVSKIEERFAISDHHLVNLAAKERRRVPREVWRSIRTRPDLASLFLRASELDETQVQEWIAKLDEKGKGDV